MNDAFNKVNPCLAKKVLTRTASEAVAKICTNALVSKALSLRRIHAGLIMKGVHSIKALSLRRIHAGLIMKGVHSINALSLRRIHAGLIMKGVHSINALSLRRIHAAWVDYERCALHQCFEPA